MFRFVNSAFTGRRSPVIYLFSTAFVFGAAVDLGAEELRGAQGGVMFAFLLFGIGFLWLFGFSYIGASGVLRVF